LGAYLVGIEVDELDDPVGIRAAGRSNQVGDRLAADFHRRGERVRDEGDDIGAAGDSALIVDKPLLPWNVFSEAYGMAGSSAERHGLGGIGNVFLRTAYPPTGAAKLNFQAGI